MSIIRRAGAQLLKIIKRALDPTAEADRVQLYSKDVAGVSQLFAIASDGTVTQLTPPSGGGGGDTIPYGGAFDGDFVVVGQFDMDRPYNWDTLTFTNGSALRSNGWEVVARTIDFASTDGFITASGGDGMPSAGDAGLPVPFGDPAEGGRGGGGRNSGFPILSDGLYWPNVNATTNQSGTYAGGNGGDGSHGAAGGVTGAAAGPVQIGSMVLPLPAGVGKGGDTTSFVGGNVGPLFPGYTGGNEYDAGAGPGAQRAYDFFKFDFLGGGSGGGGGASENAATDAGGGGGGGGGLVVRGGQILNGQARSIRAEGGIGGAGQLADTGGGGGGMGGGLFLVTGSDLATVLPWCSVAGGQPGIGTANNGTAGPVGYVVSNRVVP